MATFYPVVKFRLGDELGRYETYLATQELVLVVVDSSCTEESALTLFKDGPTSPLRYRDSLFSL